MGSEPRMPWAHHAFGFGASRGTASRKGRAVPGSDTLFQFCLRHMRGPRKQGGAVGGASLLLPSLE